MGGSTQKNLKKLYLNSWGFWKFSAKYKVGSSSRPPSPPPPHKRVGNLFQKSWIRPRLTKCHPYNKAVLSSEPLTFISFHLLTAAAWLWAVWLKGNGTIHTMDLITSRVLLLWKQVAYWNLLPPANKITGRWLVHSCLFVILFIGVGNIKYITG